MVIKRLMGAIASKIPFLATGPLGWILSGILSIFVGKILSFLFEYSERGIIFLGINIQVNEQHKRYIKAYDEYRVALDEEKDVKRKELDDSVVDFISLTGAR